MSQREKRSTTNVLVTMANIGVSLLLLSACNDDIEETVSTVVTKEEVITSSNACSSFSKGPPILEFVPADGATVVRPDTPIQIYFDSDNRAYHKYQKKLEHGRYSVWINCDVQPATFDPENKVIHVDNNVLERYTDYDVTLFVGGKSGREGHLRKKPGWEDHLREMIPGCENHRKGKPGGRHHPPQKPHIAKAQFSFQTGSAIGEATNLDASLKQSPVSVTESGRVSIEVTDDYGLPATHATVNVTSNSDTMWANELLLGDDDDGKGIIQLRNHVVETVDFTVTSQDTIYNDPFNTQTWNGTIQFVAANDCNGTTCNENEVCRDGQCTTSMRFGSQGERVGTLQEKLALMGLIPDPVIQEIGEPAFINFTETAIKAVQCHYRGEQEFNGVPEMYWIEVDGIYGRETENVLQSYIDIVNSYLESDSSLAMHELGMFCGGFMKLQGIYNMGIDPCDRCIPICDDRECGSDSCGGSCGDCGDSEVCEAGQCVSDPSSTSEPQTFTLVNGLRVDSPIASLSGGFVIDNHLNYGVFGTGSIVQEGCLPPWADVTADFMGILGVSDARSIHDFEGESHTYSLGVSVPIPPAGISISASGECSESNLSDYTAHTAMFAIGVSNLGWEGSCSLTLDNTVVAEAGEIGGDGIFPDFSLIDTVSINDVIDFYILQETCSKLLYVTLADGVVDGVTDIFDSDGCIANFDGFKALKELNCEEYLATELYGLLLQQYLP